MFNSSLDSYGVIRPQAAVQNIAGGQNAISGVSNVNKAENIKSQAKQPIEIDRAVLSNAVKKLNELVAPALQSVQFKMDEDAERLVVQVVDTATDKVLRQIPNEEVLAFSKTLGRLQGLVVREQA